MKILNVKLRGFTGIKKGLGLDEVEVDFNGLSGLVALEGPNGVGKTTFLESLQPYRMLPSRTGTLKSHCFLKDSFKEFTFEFNGQTYRTMIKIDATTTRADEGYIYKNGNFSSEVDSKVSNYDAYIQDLLGSPGLFFSSIFCAQNSRKLSDLRPAELKALFAEFLRLDRYIKWEDITKGALRICHSGIETLENQNKALDTQVRMMGNPHSDLKGAKNLLAQTNENIETFESKSTGVKKAIDELKKAVIEADLNRKRVDEQDAIINKFEAKLISDEKAYDSANLNRMMYLEEMESEYQEKLEILKHKEQIEQAVEDKLALEKKLTVLRTEADSLNERQKKQSDRKSKLEKQLNKIEGQLVVLANDIELIKLENAKIAAENELKLVGIKIESIDIDGDILRNQAAIDQMKKSAAVLDDIDPGCTSEICGLITASIDARDTLPDALKFLEKLKADKLADLQKLQREKIANVNVAQVAVIEHKEVLRVSEHLQVDKRTAVWEAIRESNQLIDETLDKIKAVNIKISALNDQLPKLTKIADKLPQLTAADNVSHALIKNIASEKLQIKLADKNYQDTNTESLKLIDDACKIVASIVIDEYAKYQLTEAETESEKLTTQLKTEQKEQTRYSQLISKCEQEIKDLTNLQNQQKTILDKTEWVRGQISEWDYLKLACSKDGMRALEIEAVAPVITANANDLLTMTFGANHSVRFETQDEDGKEVLSIIVISGDGSETPLQFLSGGEKVWILKSLRLAQTLISQEKSGRHFQTALMDEEDGALSADNAIHFIELYRSFKSMAAMDLCLYITHRAEAVALADNIIRFKPGKVAIV